MAITGTKAFTSGEILTANDVNQYLMRGVKVFSSSAVRDAAYGGAGEPVLEQGEAAFITATNTLQVYGGTADGWVDYRKAGAGQVLQVVQTVKTDTFTTTSASFVDATGLSAVITPSATSSKVLIIVQLTPGANYGGPVLVKMTGGNSGNYIGDAAGNRTRVATGPYVGSVNHIGTGTLVYLDSPATTSATTYQVQVASLISGTAIYLNRSHTDTDSSGFNRAASSITVMEISA